MEHHDDDLFDLLIELCLKSANLISDLLEHLASVEGAMRTIDPLVLIHKIPSGTSPPNALLSCCAECCGQPQGTSNSSGTLP